MKVYALTKLGIKVARSKDGNGSDEVKVLGFIRDNKTATDSELEVVADRYTIRKLKERGLLQELTT